MNFLVDISLAALIVINIALAGVSRLPHAIRLVGFQGFLIGLLPFVFTREHLAVSLVNMAVKGILMPSMLTYALKKSKAVKELEPLVSFGKSMTVVFAITLASFFFCEAKQIDGAIQTRLAIPLAFATIATGLFLIVSRRKAITQVLGFLVFENGISVFAAAIAMEYGLIVELGILLDVFVLVFILGIAIFEINRTFSSIDTDKLNRLGDARHLHRRNGRAS